MNRTVHVIIGGFDSPTELFSYLFEMGCEPSDCRAERGPDDKWRGSGYRRMRQDEFKPMMFCERANECPISLCRFEADCGCRERMCR
jgi:hypothetical protein